MRRGITQQNWTCDNCWRRKKKYFATHGWEATHYVQNVQNVSESSYDAFVEEKKTRTYQIINVIINSCNNNEPTTDDEDNT